MKRAFNIAHRKKRPVLQNRVDYQKPATHKQFSESNPLDEAVDVLNAAANLAQKITPPINSVTTDLQQVNGVVDKVESLIGGLNDTVSAAGTLADAGYALSEIPVVGQITDVLATGLRDFAKTTEALLVPLNEFKTSVLDEVKKMVGEICNVCSKINGYVNYFTTKLVSYT